MNQLARGACRYVGEKKRKRNIIAAERGEERMIAIPRTNRNAISNAVGYRVDPDCNISLAKKQLASCCKRSSNRFASIPVSLPDSN